MDSGLIHSTLERYFQDGLVDLIIHGGAAGADSSAGEWARSKYGVHEVKVNANWYLHGKAAGPMRNAAMLLLKPDLVIAFPGDRGTAHMVKLAREAGVEVVEID